MDAAFIIEQLAALVALLLVPFLPGAGLIAATGFSRTISPYHIPAAALVLSIACCAAVLAAVLALGGSIVHLAAGYGCVTAVCVAAGWWRMRSSVKARQSLHRWVSLYVTGAWMRSLHPLVVVPLALVSVLAFAVGSYFAFDTLYHVALVRRLVEFDPLTFHSTSRFVDGGANPAYVLPAWHALLAVAAFVSGADPATVWWLAPVVVTTLAALTYAGLCHTIFRSHGAAVLGAFAFLMAQIVVSDRLFYSIVYGAAPGNLTLDIVIPATIASLVVALWHRSRSCRRQALVFSLAALAVVVVLHANYVFFVGLAALGYVVMWWLNGPWEAQFTRRHLQAAGAVALVAAGGLGALYPVLSSLEHFGRGTGELGALLEDVRFEDLFTGTDERFHLRPGFMVEKLGVLGVLGVLGACVAFMRRRSPIGWLLPGSVLLILVVSQTSVLFKLVMGVGSTTAAVRLDQALMPYVTAGLTLLLLLAARWLARDWEVTRRPPRRTLLRAGGLAVGLLALVLLADRSRTWSTGLVADAQAYAVMIAFGVLVVGFIVLLGNRLGAWWEARKGRAERYETTLDRFVFDSPPSRALAAVGVIVVIGTLPLLWGVPRADGTSTTSFPGELKRELLEHRRPPVEHDNLHQFGAPLRRALQALPQGSVVLAQPETAYELMAIAPIYVAADHKEWLAQTERNRPGERLDQVERYFDADTSEAERLQILRDERVRYVVVEISFQNQRDKLGIYEDNPELFVALAETRGDGACGCRAFRLYRFDAPPVDAWLGAAEVS